MRLFLHQRIVPVGEGARLELFSLGEGPGLVITHGAMVKVDQYLPLIHRVHRATGMPVHFYHRRGRGNSSPQPANYSMRTEVGDLLAILESTGSRLAYGHSFGGAVVLCAAQKLGAEKLDAVMTYDAAANIGGSLPTAYLAEARAALDAGKPDLAIALAGKNMATVPYLPALPVPALQTIVRNVSRTSAGRQLRILASATIRELEQLKLMDRSPADSRVDVPVVLMAGGRSPYFFRHASEQIAQISGAEMVVVRGQHHSGGNLAPTPVLKRMAKFFAQHKPEGVAPH